MNDLKRYPEVTIEIEGEPYCQCPTVEHGGEMFRLIMSSFARREIDYSVELRVKSLRMDHDSKLEEHTEIVSKYRFRGGKPKHHFDDTKNEGGE